MNSLLDSNTLDKDNVNWDSETVELDIKEIFAITSKFSGLTNEGVPKSTVTYSAYDFDSPDDDPDKNNVYYAEGARTELSYDSRNGFFTLDLIFDDPSNKNLKTLWSSLQRHKSNETYAGNRNWVFYINLMENESAHSDNDTIFTVGILNPLLFFLTRQFPDQTICEDEEEMDNGAFSGGNCVRMLLHKDLVFFKNISRKELMENEDEI